MSGKYSMVGSLTSMTLGPKDHGPLRRLHLAKKDRITQLADIVCDTTLPQFIRMSKTLNVSGCDFKFEDGELLMLHYIYSKPTIYAYDTATFQKLRLPIFAEQEYEVLPQDPALDDKYYDSTEELINASPLPGVVRVLGAHCSTHPEEGQDEDDIIDIERIEVDRERGKVLVGTINGARVRLSSTMTTSRYTTMISPEFHTMSRLTSCNFPQRVRVPDLSKGSSNRNRKTERVLRLNRFSEEKCILATKTGDAHIYSIPLRTPISFQRVEDTGKYAMDMMLSLYPLINTTWGIRDPSQEALPASMEAIPQPIEQVLQAWLASWEGQRRTRTAAGTYENTKELLAEIKRLKNDVDAYKLLVSKPQARLQFPPSRPPRVATSKANMPTRPAPKPPRDDGKKKLPASGPPFRRDGYNPYATYSQQIDPVEDLDTYEFIDVDKKLKNLMPASKISIKTDNDQTSTAGQTKTGNLNSLTTRYDALWIECQELKKENQDLKQERQKLINEIHNLQNLEDEEDYYTLVASSPKDESSALIKQVHPDPPEEDRLRSGKAMTRSLSSPPVHSPRGLSPVVSSNPIYSLSKKSVPPPPVLPRQKPGQLKKSSSVSNTQPNTEPAIGNWTTFDTANAKGVLSEKSLRSDNQPKILQYEDTPKNDQGESKQKSRSAHLPLGAVKLPAPPTAAPRKVPNPQTLVPPATDSSNFTQGLASDSGSGSLPHIQVRPGLTSDEVGLFLENCKLGQYAKRFVENDINGDLLIALDEEIMIEDLEMTRIDARKLSLAISKSKSLN